MAKRYFDKFPIVQYNGYNVRNLLTAAKVVNHYVNLPYVYDQLEVKDEQRADNVAYNYYGDQYMTWAIYYANRTVDPYYGWHLSEDDFNKHLIDKYGAIETAVKKVIEFRSNWYSDDRELSPSQFVALFGEYKEPHAKYWSPIYNETTGRILSYVRRQSNNVINTNKLVRVNVANNSPSKFIDGDVLDIRAAVNGTSIATAEIVTSNTTQVTIKNLIGSTISNGYYLSLDSNSDVYCTISSYSTVSNTAASTWTITNIPAEEYVYWAPYTAYDLERDKNEENKNIKMITPQVAIRIADGLEEVLSGTR